MCCVAVADDAAARRRDHSAPTMAQILEAQCSDEARLEALQKALVEAQNVVARQEMEQTQVRLLALVHWRV